MQNPIHKQNRGFTLIEVVVGLAIFLIVALATYGAFTAIFQLAAANQARTLAVALATEQFETIRNMPYSNVGIVSGIPRGTLPDMRTLVRGGIPFVINLAIRNVNLSTSTVQASSKLVEVEVLCSSCKNYRPVTLSGLIAPANLQSAANGGALVVQVFDSKGQPVQGAQVHVVNIATTTSIVVDDETNNNGILNIIGVPPGGNAYRISVTKNGYSTDRTYPPNAVGNPQPTKPDVTIVNQQVTQISLSIDQLSTVNVSSVTPLCSVVPNFHFSMVGSKEIGVGIPKYTQNLFTNGSGLLNMTGMEWDTYNLSPTDSVYDLAGINPLSPFVVEANSSQNLQLIVLPKTPKTLVVTVIDSVTKLPVSNATVTLTGPNSFSRTLTTGRGYMTQSDWSLGSGQSLFVSNKKYWADDGNVEVSSSTSQLTLKNVFGTYSSNGILESSTFDTGSISNFYTLNWAPLNQPPAAGANSLKFQFATNVEVTATTTWNFVGPDNSTTTYFTISGSNTPIELNSARYARYRAYLSTAVTTTTPSLSNVAFTYTSSCIPPGQVIFSGLTAGQYLISVSGAGYSTNSTVNVNVSPDWQQAIVTMSP
jgi:prepilin-type N-terminal cleavage/methylation domain-containing protein